MRERTYPCQALVKKGCIRIENSKKTTDLSEIKVTVLTKEAFWKEETLLGHKVVLPEGFPSPPKGHDAWIIDSRQLNFENH